MCKAALARAALVIEKVKRSVGHALFEEHVEASYFIANHDGKNEPFVLSDFGDDVKYLYHELRANFLRGWHRRHTGPRSVGAVKMITDVYRAARDRKVGNSRNEPIIKKDLVTKFLPFAVKRVIESNDDFWEGEVDSALNRCSRQDAADAEQQLEDILAKYRNPGM